MTVIAAMSLDKRQKKWLEEQGCRCYPWPDPDSALVVCLIRLPKRIRIDRHTGIDWLITFENGKQFMYNRWFDVEECTIQTDVGP